MTVDTAARTEIGDLNARFAWALDLHDWTALHEILAVNVHYVSVGREFHDAESVVESFRARGTARTTRHGLGNLLLRDEVSGAVEGRGTWHTFASNDRTTHRVPLFMVADFLDTYRRDASGAWRITERIIVPVFRDDRLAPPSPSGAGR
ncbi:nuclear transport factor 2 family protein [Amycolatopsis sp. cmx-4-68]|uniref:nuclear transport factor 2 family protein n=1 Tax=Amycolatopsis sp. cmx-4-68 TaxID=2790938 RepID=UPI003979AA4D